MPRTCSTCTHPQRSAIEAALVTGEPLRNISKRFEMSPAALLRHRNRCVSKAIVKAKDAAEVTGAEALLGRLRTIESDARRIVTRAEKEGDLRAALVGLRQLADLLELALTIATPSATDAQAEARRLAEVIGGREGIEPERLLAEAERIAAYVNPTIH